MNTYEKRKEFLICVDSDGTAMDTMEPKHRLCFAPLFADEFKFIENRQEVIDYWLWYNLYSKHRGVNRFKGCAHLLERFAPTLSGLREYIEFVDISNELSNRTLEIAIEITENNAVMKRVLNWSLNVNKRVNEIDELLPFKGVEIAFEKAAQYCDIAAVSSANKKALYTEWEKHGLANYCSVLMSQEEGTKSQCIAKLLKLGYDKHKVIMVGDAIGDLEAALENGVYFYPITIKKEVECWSKFITEALLPLISGKLNNDIQKTWISEFNNALGG